MGTKLLMSTAYHPQTDGTSERAVWSVTQVLCTMVNENQLNWVDHIPMTEFTINSSTNTSTGMPPFEANYGYMPTLVRQLRDSPFRGVQEFAEQAWARFNAAHNAIIASRVFQAHYANQRRSNDPPITVGNKVFLSTENITLPKGRATKLLPKYIGPYKVLEASPESTYKIKLPPELVAWRIHPWFHVSKLRPYIPNDDAKFPS